MRVVFALRVCSNLVACKALYVSELLIEPNRDVVIMYMVRSFRDGSLVLQRMGTDQFNFRVKLTTYDASAVYLKSVGVVTSKATSRWPLTSR